ncbi:PqqD family protein [candidate division KSB1 bacterium]|nr:PqqD family protein [candidate division KSB1 bacterium]
MIQQTDKRIANPGDKLYNRCYTKDSSIVSRKIADEFILVPIRQKAGDLDNIYTMNEVAARIWELIDGKKRVEEIRNAIVEEFDVEPQEAEPDLIEFLQKLENVGIIREI